MAKFEYMERAFSSELRPRARLVLQVLVLHCNKEGECFPSIKTIAAKCGYGISTVKQARFDKRKNGGQTSNLYTLCVEEPQRPTESGLYLPDEKTYGTESGCLPVTDSILGEQITLPSILTYSFINGLETASERQKCRPDAVWAGGQPIFIPP